MTVQLIPVLEIVYGNQSVPIPDKYPYWEHANIWNKYYQDNYLKAGFVGLSKPYLEGSPFYQLTDITDNDLSKLIKDQTQDLRSGKYSRAEAAALSGGYILNINKQDQFFPQCCGELSDIIYWEKLSNGNVNAYYEGHPAPNVSINNNIITFDFSIDEFDEAFQPLPPDIILQVDRNALKKAVEQAKEKLEIFSKRLRKINELEQLNINDIDSLLIWNNPNQ